jgi:hypothetical protein
VAGSGVGDVDGVSGLAAHRWSARVGSLVVAGETSAAAPATVAARLAAVVAFYRYAESAGYPVRVPHASTAWPRQRRFQSLLAHTADRSTPRAGVLRVARGHGGPPPILTPTQVEAILDGCASFDAGSRTWRGSLRDRLLFTLLAGVGPAAG